VVDIQVFACSSSKESLESFKTCIINIFFLKLTVFMFGFEEGELRNTVMFAGMKENER